MKFRSSAHRLEPSRERFSPPAAVAGIVVSFLLLLVILFPGRPLTEQFARQGGFSPALISYLEAALAKHPDDLLVRTRLAEALVDAGEPRRAIMLLTDAPPALDELGLRRLKARYRALLLELSPERQIPAAYRSAFLQELEKTLDSLVPKGATAGELMQYAADCRRVGAVAVAEGLEKRIGSEGRGAESGAPVMADSAEAALGRGDYRESARLCFEAMGRAGNIRERRALFLKGVKTLQSGNLLAEALAAADRNIDGLAMDRETLLFLTRLSLAAGDPERAQRYIRKALGMAGPDGHRGKG